jgi:hypothetical protein
VFCFYVVFTGERGKPTRKTNRENPFLLSARAQVVFGQHVHAYLSPKLWPIEYFEAQKC